MFKNALVSVSDKTGLIEFLKPYARSLRIVSTGGTAQYLKDHGFTVVDVSEQTGFPEVMGGRVKTLHPAIHMALLCRGDEPSDIQLLKEKGLSPFDLVICNLYPFEQAVLSKAQGLELIEKIDIGGPAMLRASAKNFSQVTVLCDPTDYAIIAAKKEVTLDDRRKLASKVFAHVSSYDSLVASQLSDDWDVNFSRGGHKVMDLRYGENPHQQATWYRNLADNQGLHTAQIIQGKALSYNNILDLDAASQLVQMFSEPAAVAVKHNNPCGVAIDKDFTKAVDKALKSDPISVFGGIIAVNRIVDQAQAELLQNIFLECIVAPDYSAEALNIFAKKKNLRILKWQALGKSLENFEMKSVSGGFLLQSKDKISDGKKHWQTLISDSKMQVNDLAVRLHESTEQGNGSAIPEQIESDLMFAEKVCASLKSNAIALVKNGQTLGLGMGQVNRVDAVAHAIERMQKHFGDNQQQVVMASDAFFPFADSIEKAAQAGVNWVIQPGGSIKDEEVLAAAKKLKVNMVLTGERHFKH